MRNVTVKYLRENNRTGSFEYRRRVPKVLEGIDTGTATGKLMLTLLGGVAEFERSIMLERQREGIAKAKAAGKYKGRKPTAKAKAREVLELHAEGVGGTEIAKRLSIGRASVYRILNTRPVKSAKRS